MEVPRSVATSLAFLTTDVGSLMVRFWTPAMDFNVARVYVLTFQFIPPATIVHDHANHAVRPVSADDVRARAPESAGARRDRAAARHAPGPRHRPGAPAADAVDCLQRSRHQACAHLSR